MKKFFLFSLVLCAFLICFVLQANADLLHVGSGRQYQTIQSAADAAQPGDTCIVHDGTYNETVTPPRDGASGNWITFQAAPGNAPLMTGGWDLEGRDYIIIDGFTCGSFDSSTYSGAAVSNIKILNNTIQNCSIGVNLKGNDVLVSGNVFDNLSNDMVRQFGDRWTIRNNVVIDETDSNDEHMDFWQSWCNPDGVAASYILIENNVYINISGGNVHFTLINGTASCQDPTTHSIIRYNIVNNIGSAGSYIDNNSAASGSTDNVLYNNTWIKIREGSFVSWQTGAHSYDASAHSSGINNIFYDSLYPSGAEGFFWATGGAQSYNLYYDPDNIMTFSGLASNETGAVKNQDPLFLDTDSNDFSLQQGSPAIDKGGPLTRVSSADTGSGTSLIVEKAEFFQPGWGGADADTIAVGSASNIAQIDSIDYNSNTLLLTAPLTRSVSDPVWLYKRSDGTRIFYGSAPDIGAVEFQVSGPDIEDPIVSLTVPSNNSTIWGSITVSANALDNVGVVGVQFKVDGNDFGQEDISAPYSETLDTRGLSDGTHVLTAVARDAAHNTGTSSPVTVTIDNTMPLDKGDVNSDGKVDILDMQTCVNVVLEAETDAATAAHADINGDGNVNVFDIQEIVVIILGE